MKTSQTDTNFPFSFINRTRNKEGWGQVGYINIYDDAPRLTPETTLPPQAHPYKITTSLVDWFSKSSESKAHFSPYSEKQCKWRSVCPTTLSLLLASLLASRPQNPPKT